MRLMWLCCLSLTFESYFPNSAKVKVSKEVNLLQVSILLLLLLLICLWEEGSRSIPMLKYGLWSEVNSQLLALACWWIDLGPCSLEAGIDGWHLSPDLLRRWGLWKEKGMAEGDNCLFLLLSLYRLQQSLPELSQFRVLKKHLMPPCPPFSPSSPCSCGIGRSYARKRLGAQGFHMVGLILLATSCH